MLGGDGGGGGFYWRIFHAFKQIKSNLELLMIRNFNPDSDICHLHFVYHLRDDDNDFKNFWRNFIIQNLGMRLAQMHKLFCFCF